MHTETQIKTCTSWSILPWNSLGRYIAHKNRAEHVRGIAKGYGRKENSRVEAGTGGGEKVSTKIQLK